MLGGGASFCCGEMELLGYVDSECVSDKMRIHVEICCVWRGDAQIRRWWMNNFLV